MATITVRVSEEIKKEMKRLKHINWSKVVREAIAEEIKREKMRRASQTIEELRAKSKIRWDSVAVIREWREKRR
jgi:predicted transcriptional regulator